MRRELRRYRVGAWTLASEIALDGAGLAEGGDRHDWMVTLGRARRPVPARPFHRWITDSGRPWIAFSRDRGTYLLRVAGQATFRVDPPARRIVIERPRVVPDATLRHLLLNQIWPLALSDTHTVLHASGVVLPDGALLFAGAGGSGKSTLATVLARQGWPLVSDDMVPLDRQDGRWRAVPGQPMVRLWPDAVDAVFGPGTVSRRVAGYTTKRGLDVSTLLPMAPAPCGVAAVCLLDPDGAGQRVSLTRLSPREAVLGLVPVTFQLDVASADAQRRIIDALASLAASVPVFRVALPRRLEAVGQTAARLVAVVTCGKLPA